MNHRSIVAIGAVLMCLSACGQKDSSDSKTSALEKRVGALEKTVADHQKSLDQQKVTNEAVSMELQDVFDNSAAVDTTTKNFSMAHNQYGAFTVAVKKLEPYLDGYKATIDIGNLSYATLTGASIKVYWGQYAGFGHVKDFKEPDDFAPGRFTEHEFVLTPAKADEVKTINVSLDFSGAKLLVPPGSSSHAPVSSPDRQSAPPAIATNVDTAISKCVASVHSAAGAAPNPYDKPYYEGFDAYYNQATGLVNNNATRVGDQAPLYLFQKCMASAGVPLK